MIRCGVIGIGNMGTAHAKTIHEGNIEGMVLAAVCDLKKDRLDFARDAFPEAAVYEDYHQMLSDAGLDAVIVAVPHPLHAKICGDCLEKGLHTLSEKPADITVSAARKAAEAGEKSGKIFAIMLNQRTNAIFQKAREIVQSGALGELKRSVWIITNWYRTQHYYDSGAWRATWAGEGGGVLLNQAPHNLDLWQWICGMPVSVTAFCDIARYHHIEVEDDATILTRYANGATGVFITSTGEYPGTNRLEIAGELGKIVLEGGKLRWWKLKTPEKEVRFQSDVNFAKIDYDYEELKPEIIAGAHAAILQNFANAISRGEPLLSPYTDGLNELTISNAAYLSSWNGGREIALPFDEAAFDQALMERASKSVFRPEQEGETPDGQYSNRWQVNW